MISGFLITGLLVDELEGTGSISFGSFYARRVRRLLPMAALVLIAVAVGMEFFTPPVFRPAVRFDALSAAFYYSNWQFAFESVNYLTFGGAQNPVLHYWSLSVEEQFYLFWPFLLLAAVKLRRKGRAARRVRLRLRGRRGLRRRGLARVLGRRDRRAARPRVLRDDDARLGVRRRRARSRSEPRTCDGSRRSPPRRPGSPGC